MYVRMYHKYAQVCVDRFDLFQMYLQILTNVKMIMMSVLIYVLMYQEGTIAIAVMDII